MKPSRGRVSFAPADEGWGGFSIHNAVSWSVRDSAVLLDAISVPEPGDPYWLAPPAEPFAREVGRDPGGLRIAFSTTALAAPEIDPECAAAVREAAKLCESLGHHIEEASLPGDYAAVGQAAEDGRGRQRCGHARDRRLEARQADWRRRDRARDSGDLATRQGCLGLGLRPGLAGRPRLWPGDGPPSSSATTCF